MADPRDIALAIRIPTAPIISQPDDAPSSGIDPTSSVADEGLSASSSEEMEEMFDEVGMEFLDETSPIEDDDERRMSLTFTPYLLIGSNEEGLMRVIAVPVLEKVRQTLMTHMWPNMVRKPLSHSTRGIDDLLSPSASINGSGNEGPPDEEMFPTTFARISTRPREGDDMAQMPNGDLAGSGGFPGLDELKSQIMLEDMERIGSSSGMAGVGLSRLEMMDQDDEEGDWVQAEYSRLDDWLDADDQVEQGTQLPEHDDDDDNREDDDDKDDKFNDNRDAHDEREHQDCIRNSASMSAQIDDRPIPEESQFEDDFADFTAFQSAPPATSNNLPMDPTPLLLHLQSVREELAGMDEDTRRVRAGKEVESVLKSLGLGGLDWDDDGDFRDLEDLDGLLPPAPRPT